MDRHSLLLALIQHTEQPLYRQRDFLSNNFLVRNPRRSSMQPVLSSKPLQLPEASRHQSFFKHNQTP